MSHIVEIDLIINDLAALKAAVAAIPGLEWKEGKKTYNWYGRSVGNYPLPVGMTKEELGHCEHAIGVAGKPNAYEVGVVKRKDGKGFSLVLDFWNGGGGLCALVGEKVKDGKTHEEKAGLNCLKVANSYAAQVSAKAMKKKGYKTSIKCNQEGAYEVSCTK